MWHACEIRNGYKMWVGKEKRLLGRTRRRWRIVLRRSLKKELLRICIGFMWLRIGSISELCCEHGKESLDIIKEQKFLVWLSDFQVCGASRDANENTGSVENRCYMRKHILCDRSENWFWYHYLHGLDHFTACSGFKWIFWHWNIIIGYSC